MGLFAYKTFPKNSKVASYSGALVPSSEAKDSQYAVAWRRGKVVDAKSTQHSVGRYANTCRGADKRRKKCKGIILAFESFENVALIHVEF
jgi:hypothetical protein